jgi:hypothetical protein
MVVFYPIWPKILLRSLRKYFQHDLIVIVNHLNGPIPSQYYDDKCVVLQCKTSRSHGHGVDTAVEYLRSIGTKYMVLVEPDCVVTGVDWVNGMISIVESGALMGGPFVLPFGPIHPCPSVWDLEWVPFTFNVTPRSGPVDYKIFSQAGMVKWLVECFPDDEQSIWWWINYWDCGIRNWYEAAKEGRAIVSNGSRFKHFGAGRLYSPDQLSASDFALVSEYLY